MCSFIHTHFKKVCIILYLLPKYRKNFTLSVHTLKLLDEVDNKSEMIDNAVEFYLNNKDKKTQVEKSVSEFKNVVLEI